MSKLKVLAEFKLYFNTRQLRAILLLIMFSAFYTSSVEAHSVVVWAEVKNNNRIEVKAYASNGKLLKNGHVVVRGLNNELRLEGEISSKGIFSFEAKAKESLVITVILDQNHQGEFRLDENDFDLNH